MLEILLYNSALQFKARYLSLCCFDSYFNFQVVFNQQPFHDSQRVRPTIHDVITSKIKAYSEDAAKSSTDKHAKRTSDVSHSDGPIPRFQTLKQNTKNGASVMSAQLVVSPISPAMAPTGDAQRAASQLLRSIFECLLDILGRCYVSFSLISYKNLFFLCQLLKIVQLVRESHYCWRSS